MPKIKKELEEIKDKTKKVLNKKSGKKVEKISNKIKKENSSSKKAIQNKAENKKKTAKTVEKSKVEKKSKTSKEKSMKKDASKVAKKQTNTENLKTTNKSTKNKTSKKIEQKYLQEYYDLPYRYNETVVKILAQTPKRLFVYWEVSEKDRETYLNAFGEDFFEKTYPVLLVHNEEMNYTFEVPINDFANSWYLDIQDPKTKYVVQLGRKFRNIQDIKTEREIIQKDNINLQNDFVYITDSNELEVPNDHILFETLGNQVTYRNVKTGDESKKDISEIISKLNKSYKDVDIEDIYKRLYGEEISDDILSNPSSGALSSSEFKIK